MNKVWNVNFTSTQYMNPSLYGTVLFATKEAAEAHMEFVIEGILKNENFKIFNPIKEIGIEPIFQNEVELWNEEEQSSFRFYVSEHEIYESLEDFKNKNRE